jgi:hypothetical protein
MAAIGVFPEAARSSAAAAFSCFRVFVRGALRRIGFTPVLLVLALSEAR